MHEMSVAQSILDTILEQSAKLDGARPVCAKISCGQFNALNDEAMQFAFEAAADGTVCSAMRLQIKHIPLRGKCKDCGEVFEFDVYHPHCSACNSQQFSFEPDAPLLLEEIEFENSEDKSK